MISVYELQSRRSRLLGPAYRLFYDRPVHIVRGKGVWLFDADGQAYLDAYNNVASLGHARPEIVAALADQSATLNTHTRYLHDAVLDYAERLLKTLPSAISQVMFTCTGSEANDLAYRIVKAATGGSAVVVTSLAYHGGTDATAAFSPSIGAGVPLGQHVRAVAPPDKLRDGADAGIAFASRVAAAFDDLKRHGIAPAMLLLDTIFSSDGVLPGDPGMLVPAVQAARDAGALFVADEVQPGLARTGEAMWGFARHNLVPDLVTMGKPMGNGHPLAAVAARPEHLEEFGARSRYFNTFGGNPVSARVGLAVLDVVESEGLQANAFAMGGRLRHGLGDIATRWPVVGDVRGAGLFLGVELLHDGDPARPAGCTAGAIMNELRDRGVLVSICGSFGNVLKVRPPLVFDESHVDLFLDRLEASLVHISG